MEEQILPFLYDQIDKGAISHADVEVCLADMDRQPIEAILARHGLRRAYEEHVEHLNQMSRFDEKQKISIMEQLRVVNESIARVAERLERNSVTLDALRADYDHWIRRSKLYPDNPNIIAQLDKHRALIADEEAVLKPDNDSLKALEGERADLMLALTASL